MNPVLLTFLQQGPAVDWEWAGKHYVGGFLTVVIVTICFSLTFLVDSLRGLKKTDRS